MVRIPTTFLALFLVAGATPLSLATETTSTPRPGVEVIWSAADDHPTTGVTVHIEVLTGLEDEAPHHLGRTAAMVAWLLRAPLPRADGESLMELATRAGVTVLTDVDWRRASVTLWGPEETGPLLLWLAGARLERPETTVEASAIREGMDSLSGRWQDDAVGPLGDGFDTIRRHMLGIHNGSTKLSSFLHATRMEDDALVEAATEAALEHPARVVVVAGEEALPGLQRRLGAYFARGEDRPVDTPSTMKGRDTLSDPQEARLVQQLDERRRLLVAWDLAPLAQDTNGWTTGRTAALLALTYWARHSGAALPQELVAGHGLARSVEARAWLYPTPAIAIEAIGRGEDLRDLRQRLATQMERLAIQPMATRELRSAAKLARNWLSTRWAYGPDRARLIGELASAGRTQGSQWLDELYTALDELTAKDIADLGAMGLNARRRTSLKVIPRAESDVDRVRLDGDQIASYLRLVVDLRCPPPGAPKEISTLLRQKYDMAPRRYVAITRALAANPALMRDISEEAERRCEELSKLRRVLPPTEVVALHEAIACGPGLTPKTSREKRQLARVWRRFDIDPSWYRPLLEATREDPGQAPALHDIDKRCSEASEGP